MPQCWSKKSMSEKNALASSSPAEMLISTRCRGRARNNPRFRSTREFVSGEHRVLNTADHEIFRGSVIANAWKIHAARIPRFCLENGNDPIELQSWEYLGGR